jgi:hypothetical protein
MEALRMRIRVVAILVAALLVVSLSAQLLACEKCVVGNDNQAYCKDPAVYTVGPGQLYAECQLIKWCYRLPDGSRECWSQCDGQLCFIL